MKRAFSSVDPDILGKLYSKAFLFQTFLHPDAVALVTLSLQTTMNNPKCYI